MIGTPLGVREVDVLVIRESQQEALRQDRKLKVRELQVADLLREVPSARVAALTEPELTRLVRDAITRAGAHGILAAEHVLTFAVLMLELSPRFDEHPVARALLAAPDFRPEQFHELLVSRATAIDLVQMMAMGGNAHTHEEE